MDDVIAFIIELVFDIGSEVASDKKAPKWIRYPLIILVLIFYAAVTIGLLICGFIFIEENTILSLIIIGVAILFIIGGARTFHKKYQRKKNDQIEPYV